MKLTLTKEAFEYYILWLLVTVFLGMPQLWLDLFMQLLGFSRVGIQSGPFQNLLFVASELVISAAYGIWLTHFRKGVKPILVIYHILFPLLLIIVNCALYLMPQSLNGQPLNGDAKSLVELLLTSILAASFVYASWGTIMVFSHEYQTQFVQRKIKRS